MSFDELGTFVGELSTDVLIPFVQGNVFRPKYPSGIKAQYRLNPFRTGQCLSTQDFITKPNPSIVLIPFVQGNVFRRTSRRKQRNGSLRLNPFRTGQCLSTFNEWYVLLGNKVLIPFVQGNVFRLSKEKAYQQWDECLNPFRTGQCLSTQSKVINILVRLTS